MGGRRLRAVVLIAIAVVVVAGAALEYLKPFEAGRSAVSPTASPTVPAGSPLSCPATDLAITGAYNECAFMAGGQNCPRGNFDQAWQMLVHGTGHTFFLYVELNGVYRGPGSYVLQPWPHASFGVADGVAKVALREYVSGRLWESSAGSLTIDSTSDGGWVYAGLGPSTASPVQVDVNLAGWWTCS